MGRESEVDGGAWQRLCTTYDVRRWQTGSAYVRRMMYDVRLPNLRALRGEKAQAPMYDVRFANNAQQSCGNLAEQVRAGCLEAVIGRGYKGAVALTPPMDDGGAWQRPCTIFDVRCTIAELARVARRRWRLRRRRYTIAKFPRNAR